MFAGAYILLRTSHLEKHKILFFTILFQIRAISIIIQCVFENNNGSLRRDGHYIILGFSPILQLLPSVISPNTILFYYIKETFLLSIGFNMRVFIFFLKSRQLLKKCNKENNLFTLTAIFWQLLFTWYFVSYRQNKSLRNSGKTNGKRVFHKLLVQCVIQIIFGLRIRL